MGRRSSTTWLGLLKEGAARLRKTLGSVLSPARLAHRKLAGIPNRAFDGRRRLGGVRQLYRGVKGQFPQLNHRGDLWQFSSC
jgi:hypothetical protein